MAKSDKIYLDYNSTTPCDPDVIKALICAYKNVFANASSSHSLGKQAAQYAETSRLKIAELLGVESDEIYFTSGGTESNNMAIRGVAYGYSDRGSHIITTAIEHPSVLNTCEYLRSRGFKITHIPVDEWGLVDPLKVEAEIRPETILISVMYANNETGVIQPVEKIARIAATNDIVFHTDAVQALGKTPVRLGESKICSASFSAHKIYGPRGLGCIYLRKGIRMENLMSGGSQEGGKRPGTINVPGIMGFASALEKSVKLYQKEKIRIKKLAALLFKKLDLLNCKYYLNGHAEKRLENTLNISFPELNASRLITDLDAEGILVSAGAACRAGSNNGSHVLVAMGLSRERVNSAIRISLGRFTREQHITKFAETLGKILK
ncbi:MAG: cysteine desulfurase family protein [bacterium]